MTPNFRYIGNRVGVIHAFWMVPNGAILNDHPVHRDNWAANQAALTKDIADHAQLGLIAITADYIQSHAHPFLKAQGFKKVLTFKSAHDNAWEHLTMWVRAPTSRAKVGYREIESRVFSNCSVGFDPGYEYDRGKRMQVRTRAAKGLTKVRGLNVWYGIEAKHVVKSPAA